MYMHVCMYICADRGHIAHETSWLSGQLEVCLTELRRWDFRIEPYETSNSTLIIPAPYLVLTLKTLSCLAAWELLS